MIWLQTFMLVMVFGLWPALAWSEVPVPPPQGRVTDLTGTLSAEVDAELETRLGAFAARTGAEVVALVVASTHPETIETYSMRVAETWKPGQQGKDNGVLLLIAKEDRKLRIEVGYGLEGTLTDLAASRIIGGTITPAFKRGDFVEGIRSGLGQIIETINGNELTGLNEDDGFIKVFLADIRRQPLIGVMFLIPVLGFIALYTVLVGKIIRYAKPSMGFGFVAVVLVVALGLGLGAPMLAVVMFAAFAFPFALIISLFRHQRQGVRLTVGGITVGGDGATHTSSRSSSSFSSGGSFGGGGSSGSW